VTTVAASEILAPGVLRSRLLSEVSGVVHGVTGRVPGLGLADGNIGYSAPRDVHDAWAMRRRWSAAIGVDPERLVAASQVHGATVARVEDGDAGRGARPGGPKVARADALMTDRPDVPLLSLHADCVPILLIDPRRPAVAVVHAGWRGTVADVVGATVRAMSDAYGSQPADLLAFVAPAIGPCCYEVGSEVIAAWEGRAGNDASLALVSDRSILNLPEANALLLRRAGIPDGHIEQSGVCTRCGGLEWFSHRGQGPTTGRFGALVAIIAPSVGGAGR